jgi:hypothetical protein
MSSGIYIFSLLYICGYAATVVVDGYPFVHVNADFERDHDLIIDLEDG